MSLPQQKITDTKAKSKFQSLPINTIYQGAANKATSKTLPQKHGLQSLGKIPTARRAPANLPSVKSEKGGNDPSVVLVPTGGTGWTSNSKEADSKPAEKQDPQPRVKQESPEPATKSSSGTTTTGGAGGGVGAATGRGGGGGGSGSGTNSNSGGSASGPKTWSSVTGARQSRTPKFGQEFPSLRTTGGGGGGEANSKSADDAAENLGNQVGRLQLQSGAGKDDLAHGNGGPMLRPQTFGNWTQGGSKPMIGGGGGGSGQQQAESNASPDTGKFHIPQPHKPTPPSSSVTSSSASIGGGPKSAPRELQAIMPHFMGVIEAPVGLSSDSHRRISRDRPPPNSRRGDPHGRGGGHGGGGGGGGGGGRVEFTPPSIIDKEKLRRMDDLAGDDWTYDDDNFDYNKRLQSDDEEIEHEHYEKPDPNWADQVEKIGSPGLQYGGYYDENKKSTMGYGNDDSQEDRRRNKKSEEVKQNIERARKRREEEENRYRRPGSMEMNQRPEENGYSSGRRYEDANSKDSKVNERRDWTSDEKMKPRQPPMSHQKGGGGRYDDRRPPGRYEDQRSGDRNYVQQRYDGRKEEKDDYRNYDEPPHHEDEYGKQVTARKDHRGYEERDRNRSSEERSFSDFSHHEDNSVDSGWNQRSPGYSKQSSRHISGEMEIENGTSEWGAPRSGKSDWTDELEMSTSMPDQHPSRPNSRDSRVSKDSRSSKEGKNARNSMERSLKKMEHFADTKPRKSDQFISDLEQDKKMDMKKVPQQSDISGYFGEPAIVDESKKMARTAPGPITREKLEASSQRDNNLGGGMTQLKKRDPVSMKPDQVKAPEPEVIEKLNPLVDSDLLENISDDDDGLLGSPEKDDKIVAGGKGRGGGGSVRGNGRGGGQERKLGPQRGGRGGMDRGSSRGAGRGRADAKGNKGRPGDFQTLSSFDESDESKKNKKNLEKSLDPNIQPPAGAFMPRGQPSRRGRGDGRTRGPNSRGGGGGMRHYGDPGDEQEIGDWGDEDMMKGRNGGKIPPRMQRKRDERRSRGEGDEIDDWENEAEMSGEEKRKRDADRGGRGGGRGGSRGWDTRGPRGRGAMNAPQMSLPLGNEVREQTPESQINKRAGIDNIDLHDFAGVVVVDQESAVGVGAGPGVGAGEHEPEAGETGEFMPVLNKKTRPPMGGRDEKKMYERPGVKIGGDNRDKYGRDFNKQNKMYAFEKRKQLPPRLAKVREESRAQARTGGVSPSNVEQNGWPEGDKMGVFQVDDLGTNAWEKTAIRRDKEGSEGAEIRSSPKIGKENGGIQQTLVFENTSLKSCKDKNSMEKPGIQLPVGMGKPEDNLDVVKLDFFGGDEMSAQGKPPLSIPRSMTHLTPGQGGIPPSPSTDDLSVKLANTKKLWDSPGMAGVPENSVATSWTDGTSFPENSAFDGFQDPSSQTTDSATGYDKSENSSNSHQANSQKGKPVSMSLEQDARPNNPMQFNRLAGNTMPAIPSPPTQLNQMGTMPQSWGYQLDRTSNMYNPYNQSILMAGTHSIGTDLFTGSNGAGGYRLQNTGHYPGTQQSTANMISQANLISGGVKHSNQIGPIGTKAGTGASTSPYLQPGLSTLSNTFIQYDASNFNFVNPTAAGLQRGNAPPTQTAFYQRQPQLALNAAIPGSYNHALSAQQQLRAANHVASLPFMKNDLSAALSAGQQQKNQLGTNDFGGGNAAAAAAAAAANFSNGAAAAANNRSGAAAAAAAAAVAAGAPTSPKTKLKLEQQQQAGVTAAGLNQLVQLRMGLGFNMGMTGVQPGFPSPIARPQMSQGAGNHGLHGKSDYYIQEGGGEEKEQDKGSAENKEGEAAGGDKGDNEAEGVVDPVQ